MVADGNRGKANGEPIEDGLSALKRLADLDNAGAGESSPDSSSQAPDEVENVPDWLELLLAKYGEQASDLVGVQPGLSVGAPAQELAYISPEGEEASEVASLLEQMAADAETEPPADRLVTSVDWGETSGADEEGAEEGAPDWMEELSGYTPDVEGQRAGEVEHKPEDEVPAWMKELGITAPGVEPREAEVTSPTPEGEPPDWLRDLDMAAARQPEEPLPAGPETEVPSDVSGPAEEGEVPDWLARLASESISEVEETSTVEPAAKAPAEPPGDELPDWLRELEAPEEEPGAEAPPGMPATSPPRTAAQVPAEPPEEEIPDWLRELEAAEEMPAAQPPSPEIAADAPPESEAAIPDWLASLREETTSPLEMMAGEEVPPADYPKDEAAEEPEWLAALRIAGTPDLLELDEELVEAEEEDLPDWLAELRASRMAATTAPSPEAPPEPVEARDEGIVEEFQAPPEEAAIREVEEVQPVPPEVEYPAEEEVGALDWLAEIEAAAAAAEYAEVEAPPTAAEAPPEQEEVPDWLLQMPPADLAKEEEFPEIEEETVETRRPPEWLVATSPPGPGEGEGEVSPPTEEAAAIEVAVPAEGTPEIVEALPPAEEIAPAEIPDWLVDLKPWEVEPAELGEEEVIETEDVLAGIPGLLPIAEEELEGEEEPIAALRTRVEVPEVPDVEGAKLFKEVVAEGPEAEPMERGEAEAAPEAKRRRIVETLVWALVFIVLIIGIALALVAVLNRVGDLVGGPGFREFFGSPLVIDPAPVNTFRAQLTRLPPDSVVVVSFDYSPATEAEMRPLAQIILSDLLENEARVIAVSLRPEGPMMAQRLFESLESEYAYGERTINLGYLSGQTAGVRSLAFLPSISLFQDWTRTLDDYPTWQDVEGLDDVALIVAVADSPLAVRWWVEQMGPGTQANRPMVAAVSAAADPSVRPYYNHIDPASGQLLG